jgi:putative redox protein
MESQARVTWFGGRQFVGTDSTKHSMVMSSPDEENGTGMKPPDVLLSAIGGCTGIGVSAILLRKRQELFGFEVVVSGKHADEPPRPFTEITIEYIVKGRNIDPKSVEDAIELSLTKYCSVTATVEGKARIKTQYQIIEC